MGEGRGAGSTWKGKLSLGPGDVKDEPDLEGETGTWGPVKAGMELRKVDLEELGVVGFFLSRE